MYGVWTKKNYMMITLTYLGPVHNTYDFDKTLIAHNSKRPILPLCTKFWIDLWMDKCLLWWKLPTINIISAVQKDFVNFWLFRFFLRVQNPKFPKKCCFFSTRQNPKNYYLQEKSLCTAEITGLKKGVRNLEVGGIHMDLRIWCKAQLIYAILAIFGILKGPYWKYETLKITFVK